jgi:acyl CoA:acetate/3-ketoacid CoA transferase beta subunit
MPIAGVEEGRYTLREYLAFMGAALLQDGKSAFVGTGLPIVAAMLAQQTHAPDLLIFFEAGGVGPFLPELPTSVGESRTYYQGIAATSMHDVMSLSQAGYVDYGFLGAAQMDAFGNINTTVIGPHNEPRVRLPGSGGANDVASFSHRLIIIMANQSRRSFVEKVDFVTTAGYLDGPGARARAGLPDRCGPYRVITQLALYGFDQSSGRLMLISTHPGVQREELEANSEFEILMSDVVDVSPEPSEKDLELLRNVIDPTGMAIGR